MTVVHELLESTTARLSLLSNTPQLDAQVLLAHVFQKPRSWVLAHPELALDADKALLIETLIERSEHGEPLPYILGHWEFFGLDFELTPDVLIPRPETEVLVERAIDWLRASPDRRSVADVGSGSGCIAIALATNIPDVHILATDISLRALEVARGNAARHKVADRVDFLDCDVFPVHPDPLPTEDHFDLICANLPYIPTEKLMALPIYGREPTVALDGGPDGLDVFRKLLGLAPEWLAPGGRILLEIEATLGRAALSLAYDAFSEAELHLHKDLAGQNRLLEIQLPLL